MSLNYKNKGEQSGYQKLQRDNSVKHYRHSTVCGSVVIDRVQVRAEDLMSTLRYASATHTQIHHIAANNSQPSLVLMSYPLTNRIASTALRNFVPYICSARPTNIQEVENPLKEMLWRNRTLLIV